MSAALIVETEGARLHVEHRGEGAPILFVQGTGVVGMGWRPQLEALSASGLHCATLDNRGIGKSVATGPIGIPEMAADCVAALDALGWRSAHLVGHSLGGLICQEVALSAPERVRSLTLSCTFASGGEAVGLRWSTIWLGLRTRVGTRHMRRMAFLAMLAMEDDRTPELAERLAPDVGRDLADSPPIVMAQVRAMSRYDRSGELAKIQAPTLVQSATHDPIALTRFGRGLAERIDGARYEELAGSHGHTLIDPAPFNALLESFVLEVEGRG